MNGTRLLIACVVVLVVSAGHVQAGFIPFGPQNDVLFDTVVNDWGWTEIYRVNAEVDFVDIEDVFAGASTYVMLAAIQDDTFTIEVLAAALTSEVRTYTAFNETHTANGAEWYYNNGSMGFAGLDDTIDQSPGIYGDGLGLDERDRLSWFTWDGVSNAPGYSYVPTEMDGGARASTFLTYEGWDKVVFTMGAVPEPTSLLIWSIGLVGVTCVGSRRRKRTV
jgi:hypothetical protein